jgi:hypothetical protein
MPVFAGFLGIFRGFGGLFCDWFCLFSITSRVRLRNFFILALKRRTGGE